MNSFIKRVSVIFLFSLLFAAGWAQNYAEVFNNGVALWEGGACKEASTEFKRYIFVTEQNQINTEEHKNRLCESYRYISLYYESVQDYQKSLEFQKVIHNLNPKEEDLLREIYLSLKLAVKEKYSLEKDVDIMCYCYLDSFSRNVRITAWKALLASCAQLNLWQEFEQYYNQFVVDFPSAFLDEEKSEIESSLDAIKKFKPKKPMLAAYLSIVPGLGQLYAGDGADSLNAFVLNGGLIGVSVFSLCTGGYTEFALLEFKPVLRFYKGNIYNAQKDSYEFNEKKIKKLKAPIEKILEP